MNQVTARYVELSRNGRLRNVMTDVDLPASFRTCWGDGHLARPLFVPEEELLACVDDVNAVFDLLASLPARLFDGDIMRYCAALGIDPSIARLLRAYSDGPPTRYGRADLYHDGNSFKLLEFNVASDIGGLDLSELLRALMEVDAFAEFATEQGLDYVHSGERIAHALRTASPRPEPTVAILCAQGELERYRYLLDSTASMFRRLGLTVVLGELPGVSLRRNHLYLDGTRVDVVLRYFTVDHVPGNDFIEPVLRAHEAGTATLWTSMDSSLYSNKGALSLLSDPRTHLAADERELVDRVLPWTRALTAELVDQCHQEKDQLLVKPPRDFGGRGVVAGWEASEADWKALLANGVRNSNVVQRRVVPAPEPVVDAATGAVANWTAAWGLLTTPEGYAGAIVRALPEDEGAIVNYGANPAAKVSGAFTYRQ